MAKYRILTMDGGGVRGVLTARLLERIEAERNGFLSRVDLFAGTSTGSILTIGLAMGLSPTELVTLYRTQAPHIFQDSIFHDVGDLWGLVGAKYGTKNRYDALHPTIGNITLEGLLPKHVLVATFELDSHSPISPAPDPRAWKAKFFHNYAGPDSDGDQAAIDVIMRSSAAPTFFPIYQGFIDGGVVANNPSMCALAQAINPQTGGKQDIKDVVLLSLGTGARPQYLTSQDGDWGLQQWGFKLLDLLFDAGSGLADYQCKQLLADCYTRLNPDLPTAVGLDAVSQMDMLIQIADETPLDNVLAWIDAEWM